MKTVEMPKMGDTMEEGKILRWIKHEGDPVKKGESLAEVETDKVNIEIEAFASGVLRKILVAEGDSAPIGSGIALIGAPDEPLPEGAKGAETKGESAKEDAINRVPTEGTNGKAGAPATQPAPAAQNATTVVQDAPATYDTDAQGRVFISPVARRLAEESSIDYTHIRGTGPNGRIIKMDVEAALAQAVPAGARAAQAPPPVTTPAPAPTYVPFEEAAPAAVDRGEVVEIPLTAMRRTIARRLRQSMQTAPHFYVTSVIDTGKLAELRRQINAYAANDPSPVKVSFNDLIIKAVARSLVKMPQVNVSFAEDKLLQKKAVHIGMAVALEQGLIVPV
ncbi:MAG TPA: dihydrolipoamide acetyltransferase family protein, partial [Ktedonobacteraceae bacterium]|nr:dihydrolipoamide acetyltransferase family protein [Ktedonobacteraceae bacterium]